MCLRLACGPAQPGEAGLSDLPAASGIRTFPTLDFSVPDPSRAEAGNAKRLQLTDELPSF